LFSWAQLKKAALKSDESRDGQFNPSPASAPEAGAAAKAFGGAACRC
jgi:hypothetical protein